MKYAIAHEGDLIASVDSDVLDAILIVALDHYRELVSDAYTSGHIMAPEHRATAQRFADAIADVIHDVEADKEGREESRVSYTDAAGNPTTTPRIYTEVETLKAEADYVALVKMIGSGFHPDTRGADYANLPDGVTPEDVDRIVETAFEAYEYRDDVYGQALDIIHELEADERGVCSRCGAVVEWSEADSAWSNVDAAPRMELICDEAAAIGHTVA